jgi:hypothetical protein
MRRGSITLSIHDCSSAIRSVCVRWDPCWVPTKRQTFLLSVASTLTATLVTSLASLLLDAPLDLARWLAIGAVSLITGLAVFAGLAWHRQGRLEGDLLRLERAAWPGWMRDIGLAAADSGLTVFRDGEHVIFVGPAGDRYLLAANPAGERLGQVLERDRALEQLAEWGVPVRRNTRGQPMAPYR